MKQPLLTRTGSTCGRAATLKFKKAASLMVGLQILLELYLLQKKSAYLKLDQINNQCWLLFIL